jgi:hypothetical protein
MAVAMIHGGLVALYHAAYARAAEVTRASMADATLPQLQQAREELAVQTGHMSISDRAAHDAARDTLSTLIEERVLGEAKET